MMVCDHRGLLLTLRVSLAIVSAFPMHEAVRMLTKVFAGFRMILQVLGEFRMLSEPLVVVEQPGIPAERPR